LRVDPLLIGPAPFAEPLEAVHAGAGIGEELHVSGLEQHHGNSPLGMATSLTYIEE
jgi:hypothetical protein